MLTLLVLAVRHEVQRLKAAGKVLAHFRKSQEATLSLLMDVNNETHSPKCYWKTPNS